MFIGVYRDTMGIQGKYGVHLGFTGLVLVQGYIEHLWASKGYHRDIGSSNDESYATGIEHQWKLLLCFWRRA